MAGNKDVSFSPREMEVLALAWQCMETQPKIDMTKLAALTGYTIGSASVTFGKIKTKIRLLGESLSTNGPSTPRKTGGPGRAKATSTPMSTPKKRGPPTTSDTPAKRARKGTRQPTSSPSDDVSAADDDGDEDEEFEKKVKVKKEEPGFEHGSGFYDESAEDGSAGTSYGFLDGIETFGAGGSIGGGRSAATGYRKLVAPDAE
ncbi:hypothetical protein ACET3X_004880 [Alternaria dauci]|uniref:Uncharacterized protein n=1 Tax=Alternaria dauci TaxID=48095 RepID=A0ABR3UJZ7_9PLEO